MKEQTRFWFAHVQVDEKKLAVGVAAFTERSARMQVRKLLGPEAYIGGISPVSYAHAWVLDLTWTMRRWRSESATAADAVDPVGERVTG